MKQYVAEYQRRGQSPASFLLALSEVAGLAILPGDREVLAIYEHAGKTVYTFDTGTAMVDYPHAVLEEGTTYPEDTVIGAEYVRLYHGSGSAAWWSALDWSGGLPLDGLCPVDGLVLPDRHGRFYQDGTWVTASGETKKHVRVDFSEDPAAMDRFWFQAHAAEERSGLALADMDVFSPLGPSTDVYGNILDIFMRAGIGGRLLVLDLRTGELGGRGDAAVKEFARREKPVGSVLLIRDFAHSS